MASQPGGISRNEPRTGEHLCQTYASQIKGKVVLIIGVSPGGLGFSFVMAIAHSKPSMLILAGRNAQSLQETADFLEKLGTNGQVLKTRILIIDLSSLKKTKAAAGIVNSWVDVPHIDVLVNCAGIMAVPFCFSSDGLESQFSVNHLCPFLFINLIMKKILSSNTSRVVLVSSDAHFLSPIRFNDYNFDNGHTYNRWQAYGQSKTANMLMALELARRFGEKENFQAFSLNPGNIKTHLGDHLDWRVENSNLTSLHKFLGNADGWRTSKPFKKPEDGIATIIYAAFDPYLQYENGAYLENCRVAGFWLDRVRCWANSPVEANRLWRLSEKLVCLEFGSSCEQEEVATDQTSSN